jgi:predicted transcriptional regulator
VIEHEDLLSQVPKGDQDEQVVEASTSKPKKSSSQKINQLLRKLYELEVLEREIKRRNTNLVERNVELYDSFHILAKMYVKLEMKNRKLIQANQKAYKVARCSKIKIMLKKPNPIVHSGLENLAAAAENLAQTTNTLEEQP